MRWLLAATLLTALGCGASSVPCASSLACGEGRVCGLDGACGGLPPSAGHAAHRAPESWAITEDGAPRALERGDDAITIGGARHGALWLRFDPLLDAPERAVLVLHAPDPATRRAREGTITITRPDGHELARARVTTGAARPITITIPIEAQRTIELVVRADHALTVATPRHLEPRRRPRLELVLR
ncbi:hypothetical protein [Sandaracinus amylolyticus]|uniref:Uncharacterized protein n=1 Tax=Sandaracinus amylolyticus TaxID=927083 RepID=A0A0F6W3T5_9BACT|nr:hypothetical protein [Sandaracinus amylolyticus]AKF06615.1 hypothetical protein DB32_003764 [Sandaracinus amylolyticus]